MTSRDFCFWLQGYMELNAITEGDNVPMVTGDQVVCIQKHLALVFKHEIDPSMPNPELDALHAKPPGASTTGPAWRPPTGNPLVRC